MFVEIVKLFNVMLKQDAKVEWMSKAKQDFVEIKKVIFDALVLVSPYYSNPFYIYSFASDHSCTSMLKQKDDEGNENPIAFMSAPLKDVELCYHNVENKEYALVRGVNKFMCYILRNKVFAIVLNSTIKILLVKNELGER